MRDGRYGRGVWFRENGIIRGLENGPPLPVKITSCLNEAIAVDGQGGVVINVLGTPLSCAWPMAASDAWAQEYSE